MNQSACTRVPSRAPLRGRAWVAAALVAFTVAGCATCPRAARARAEREAREAAGRPASTHTPAARREEGPRQGTLYVGPRFVTVDPAAPEVAAVEVSPTGRIVALHAAVPPGRPTVVLPGTLAVPGLHDAHLHLLGIGQVRERVDLRGVASIPELRARVASFLLGHPEVTFVVGRGWDQSVLAERRMPTSADLAGLTDRPMILRRVDGHAAVVNPPLLARLGLPAEPTQPDGGRILRDAAGAPTGVLVDRAVDLALSLVPEPSGVELERWARAGAAACAGAGLVAVHDMGMTLDALAALEAVDADAPLPVRVFVYLDGDDERSYAWLEAHQGAARHRSARITVQGVKLYADGAMGSRGAALLEEYSDEAGHRGHLVTPAPRLAAQVARVHAAGGQIAIHAIGDRANRVALAAIEAAQGAGRGARHRIEHAQLVDPEDLPRFAALGVIASMQPTHATSDMRWARDRLGDARLPGAYAWRAMLASGAALVFGSDAPVESERPLLGLHAATTRTDAQGQPPGGWRPDQRVGDAEALAAFSATAAFAVHREADLGRLVVGSRFDVTLLDDDPRGVSGGWLRTRVVGTVMDGTVVDGAVVDGAVVDRAAGASRHSLAGAAAPATP